MATFEEREIVDYTIKKIGDLVKPENFMIKDLDKMHQRLISQEEKLRRIIEKINGLESRIRNLEKENFSESSSSSD